MTSWMAGGMAVLAAAALAGAEPESRRADLESFDKAWSVVRERHFDATLGGIDWDAVKAEIRPKVEAAGSRREARAAIIAMTDRLGQSHFQVIPREFLEAARGSGAPNRAEGDTGLDVRLVAGEIVVTKVRCGSPADAAGVKTGWTVLRIGGERVSDWLDQGLEELASNSGRDGLMAAAARERMEGRPGDRIEITFLTGELEERAVAIPLVEKAGVRTNIGHLKGVKVSAEWRWLEEGVGYIAFSSFIHPEYVMRQFNEAMEEFMGARGLVIDLRGNGGGMIPLAAGMSGWFIGDRAARLGEVRMREGSIKVMVQPRPNVFAGKVAILVDALSLSCAEAFAAGMQDNGRARIFGQRTAGAVLASAIEKLPNGDALQYVYADYVSRSGRRLEGAGVMPDVAAPLIRTLLLCGRDEALEKALAWAR